MKIGDIVKIEKSKILWVVCDMDYVWEVATLKPLDQNTIWAIGENFCKITKASDKDIKTYLDEIVKSSLFAKSFHEDQAA